MLTVTAVAKQRIKAKLRGKKRGRGVMVRLIRSPIIEGRWKMILDKEKAKDQVVRSEDGIKILLIGGDLVPAMEGMTMGFRKTPQGAGLAVYKSVPQSVASVPNQK